MAKHLDLHLIYLQYQLGPADQAIDISSKVLVVYESDNQMKLIKCYILLIALAESLNYTFFTD